VSRLKLVAKKGSVPFNWIPALCGRREEAVIDQALNKASQIDLEKWDEVNIPYTIRKKRQEFFKNESQKSGKNIT